jgi:hypothetical protein
MKINASKYICPCFATRKKILAHNVCLINIAQNSANNLIYYEIHQSFLINIAQSSDNNLSCYALHQLFLKWFDAKLCDHPHQLPSTEISREKKISVS